MSKFTAAIGVVSILALGVGFGFGHRHHHHNTPPFPTFICVFSPANPAQPDNPGRCIPLPVFEPGDTAGPGV